LIAIPYAEPIESSEKACKLVEIVEKMGMLAKLKEEQGHL